MPQIRKYKYKFRTEILCGALWGKIFTLRSSSSFALGMYFYADMTKLSEIVAFPLCCFLSLLFFQVLISSLVQRLDCTCWTAAGMAKVKT